MYLYSVKKYKSENPYEGKQCNMVSTILEVHDYEENGLHTELSLLQGQKLLCANIRTLSDFR